MNSSTLYLAGLGTTLLVSFLVARYLQSSLRKVLADICGTEDRAVFWTTFSNVMVTLIPTVFALHFHPQHGSSEPWVFVLGSQIEWGMIGLAGSVVTMGFVISVFIPAGSRAKPVAAPAPGGKS